MNVLVVDVGGSYVKVLATGQETPRKFPSGPQLSAQQMVSGAIQAASGWVYDVVTIGYPGLVRGGKPIREPLNLGDGWVDFDFEGAFSRPVKILNDAALQALGGYQGGRMLFLGLGTGLGSALVDDDVIVPLELGDLPHPQGRSYSHHLGARALEKHGAKRWQRSVRTALEHFRLAFFPDYVVLGGGNAEEMKRLPVHTQRGDNFDAFVGGFLLWEEVKRHRPPDYPKPEVVLLE